MCGHPMFSFRFGGLEVGRYHPAVCDGDAHDAGSVGAGADDGDDCDLVQGGTALGQTLQEALATAYENNPTLNAQRARLRATDEQVPQTLSGYRPTVRTF